MTYRMKPASEFWAALRRDEYMRGEYEGPMHELNNSLENSWPESHSYSDEPEPTMAEAEMRGERDEVEESMKDFFGESYLEPDRQGHDQ